MAYEVVMPYHLHMPSYFLETFTEYPYLSSFPKESPVCQSKDKQPPFTHYSSVIQDKYINSFLSL